MGTICTVAIHKGGTEKTTVSAHVAVLASEHGSKTLPVDLEWRHNPNRRLAFLNDRLYIQIA